jgi:heptosyltransferase-1
MHVLIVRLSSMGDLVQTLPALTDAVKARPDVRFDWVVDESFADVARWHPQVERVMTSALRRWRRAPRAAIESGEARDFWRALRSRRYDLVVDVQGELKSALAARLARGATHVGYDSRAAHEWGAQFFYGRHLHVPKGQHSITRMRRLLADALGYEYDEASVDYGVSASRLPALDWRAPTGPYVVLIHSTSWTSKNWAESYWRELRETATRAGLSVVLPWGDEAERRRAERIAGADERATVLPPMTISEKAAVIARAHSTVGLDTGLSHIAAAFDIPSVTIYGATDPRLVGATGAHQRQIVSGFDCVGCHEVRCNYDGATRDEPSCLVGISPRQVWAELERVMDGALVGASA